MIITSLRGLRCTAAGVRRISMRFTLSVVLAQMALDNALRVPRLLAMHTQTLNARIDSA
jgi:hypothetical protein